MNIQRISAMPSISEDSVTWEASSQEARHDGSWHNSDADQNSVHASRLERTLRTVEIVRHEISTPQQTNVPLEKRNETWKTVCHHASMICGLAILPSFASVAAGPIFLVIPASLTVLFIGFGLASGKPSEALQNRLAMRREEVKNFDSRGST